MHDATTVDKGSCVEVIYVYGNTPSYIMGMTSAGWRMDEWLQRTSLCQKLWPRFLVTVFLIGVTSYAIFTIASLPVSTYDLAVDDRKEVNDCNCFEEDDFTAYSESELDTERLFYNRVPKCASTTMYTIMRKLSTINRYVHHNSKVYDRKIMNEDEQNRFVRNITSTPAPCSFDRHVFFVNFSRFGARSPVYINLIRDPVERIISSYFYRRSVARQNHGKSGKPSDYWLNKKFRQCVNNADSECSFVDGQKYSVLLLPYFCGQDERCLLLNEPWALHKAKSNIEQYYAVVGVVEEMNMTLKVLEATLPRFFKGALDIYYNLGAKKNENHQKEHVAEDLKAALKANLTTEYDLYHFIVQRLYRQFRELQLNVT